MAVCLAVMLSVASATATVEATKNRPVDRLRKLEAAEAAAKPKDLELPEKRLHDLVGRHEDVVLQGRMGGQTLGTKPRHDWDVVRYVGPYLEHNRERELA